MQQTNTQQINPTKFQHWNNQKGQTHIGSTSTTKAIQGLMGQLHKALKNVRCRSPKGARENERSEVFEGAQEAISNNQYRAHTLSVKRGGYIRGNPINQSRHISKNRNINNLHAV